MKKKKTFLIFVIQAYERMDESGQLKDVVTVELIDTSEARAIERAKKLVQKPYYRLSSIIEERVK